MNSLNKHKGFTLLELITVMAIISVLSTIAVPSFVQQIKQQRIISNINHLHSTFKFARSESAKRSQLIVLDEAAGSWHVTLEGNTLASFTPSDVSITVTGLVDHSVQATGETTAGNYLVTDQDSSTTDYRLCIYVSGQSYISSEACA
jgi:type IV fimbrial biogenesis protein FimT